MVTLHPGGSRRRQERPTRSDGGGCFERHAPAHQLWRNRTRRRKAPPAVVRRPWGDARVGRRGPKESGARRSRARIRPWPDRSGRGRRAAPHGRDRLAPAEARWAQAAARGPGHTRGRCTGGGAGRHQLAWQQSPRGGNRSAPMRRCPDRERSRGRRASRHSWPRPSCRPRERERQVPPRSRTSGAIATGGETQAGSWMLVRFPETDGSRQQTASRKPPENSALIVIGAPRESQSTG